MQTIANLTAMAVLLAIAVTWHALGVQARDAQQQERLRRRRTVRRVLLVASVTWLAASGALFVLKAGD